VAFSFPNGGLGATSAQGVNETVTNAGRKYRVNTVIEDLSVVPVSKPDAGAPTLKRIRVSVTPWDGTVFDTITITTQRSTQVVGTY
jgi:hypothetical protein